MKGYRDRSKLLFIITLLTALALTPSSRGFFVNAKKVEGGRWFPDRGFYCLTHPPAVQSFNKILRTNFCLIANCGINIHV